MGKSVKEVRFRFGFDIGGTFTDLVLSGSDGSLHTGKVLTRHDQVVAPIIDGLKRILAAHRISPAQVDHVVAGATTAVTNLVIERKGACTGLIATEGFRGCGHIRQFFECMVGPHPTFEPNIWPEC